MLPLLVGARRAETMKQRCVIKSNVKWDQCSSMSHHCSGTSFIEYKEKDFSFARASEYQRGMFLMNLYSKLCTIHTSETNFFNLTAVNTHFECFNDMLASVRQLLCCYHPLWHVHIHTLLVHLALCMLHLELILSDNSSHSNVRSTFD